MVIGCVSSLVSTATGAAAAANVTCTGRGARRENNKNPLEISDNSLGAAPPYRIGHDLRVTGGSGARGRG